MTDTQVTDVVTFDCKGTGFCCIVCGTFDYQMDHNVAMYAWFVMIIV